MAAIQVREGSHADIPAIRTILNEIIRIGGTTAYQVELTEAEAAAHFLTGQDVVLCHVALDEAGAVAGFQALQRHAGLPPDVADIATFARRTPRRPGIGAALFSETHRAAAGLGWAQINATIRADNDGGLAYYAKMGFRRHAVARGVPLRDGTPVDRVSMRFDLGA
ncbi:MAG: GNAT family N-acetyltransferase [Rhodobacter sp.]|nr:GNAT family N-acetyltransferase [Rhodobacter sp.]